jgi:hypothetical protein
MSGMVSARRDDIISLTYILLFLYTGSMMFLGLAEDSD